MRTAAEGSNEAQSLGKSRKASGTNPAQAGSTADMADRPTHVPGPLAASDQESAGRRAAILQLIAHDPDLGWAAMYGNRAADPAVAASHVPLAEGDLPRVLDVPRPQIRALIADRADCPARLLEHLGLHDPVASVRARAVTNPSFPARRLADVLDDRHSDPRVAAARRTDLPARLLERVVRDPSTPVRSAVLDHPAAPASLVGRLASWRETSVDIRLQALCHPRCPLHIIERACSSHIKEIRLGALTQPRQLPPDLMWFMLTRANRSAQIRTAVIGQLSRGNWTAVARLPLLTLLEATLVEVLTGHLEHAARDPRAGIRLAAVAHPQIGPELLELLSHDEDARVRRRVSERLLDAAV